jgi:hypothetical protein
MDNYYVPVLILLRMCFDIHYHYKIKSYLFVEKTKLEWLDLKTEIFCLEVHAVYSHKIPLIYVWYTVMCTKTKLCDHKIDDDTG